MENSKVYLVKYGEGAYDDYYENTIFVTLYKHKAEAYVHKFNEVLGRLKSNHLGIDEPPNYMRWSKLNETYEAFIEEIEVR